MPIVQNIQNIQNNPIYSLPHLYISGMNISVASNTVVAVQPGQCRDATDSIDMPLGYPNLQGTTTPQTYVQNFIPPLFINSAIVGVNGLDQGSLPTGDTVIVGVWIIGDSRGYNPVAGLLSLASNAFPILPNGYDSTELLGYVTSINAVLQPSSVTNSKNEKSFYFQPEYSVLSGGSATTFTNIALSPPLPNPTVASINVYLDVVFTPSTSSSTVQFRPAGSVITTRLPTISAIAAGTVQQQYITAAIGIIAGAPIIQYKVSNSADSITVMVAGYSAIQS